MNVRNIVREIHAKVEQSNPVQTPSSGSPYTVKAELAAVRTLLDRANSVRRLVGRMPPSPDTLRGRAGKHLVRAVQRMLFWYTPQIHRFQDEAIQVMNGLLGLAEQQSAQIDALRKEITALHSDLWSKQAATSKDVIDNSGVAQSIPAAFEFALQDHFRGSEQVTAEKLAVWLNSIDSVSDRSRLRAGTWLDIGCGRGEWLTQLRTANIHAIGIDPNPTVIARCRDAALTVEQADALAWLEASADGSFAVITAFHVVEHLPATVLLNFVQLAARKLQSGGVLAVETPNAANLPMGSHHFWNDPTHQRPVPSDLLRFVMTYFGLKVVKHLELNPYPDEHHLPFTELEAFRRLDRLLYGPQDFGLIGRREP